MKFVDPKNDLAFLKSNTEFKKEIKISFLFSFPNIFLNAKSFFGSTNFMLKILYLNIIFLMHQLH